MATLPSGLISTQGEFNKVIAIVQQLNSQCFLTKSFGKANSYKVVLLAQLSAFLST